MLAAGSVLAAEADPELCTAEFVLVLGSALVPETPLTAGVGTSAGVVELAPASAPGAALIVGVCVFALAVPPLLRPAFAPWSVPSAGVCAKSLTAALAAPVALPGEPEMPPGACVAVLTVLMELFAACAGSPLATCRTAPGDGWVAPVRPGRLPVPSRDADMA